MNRAWRFAPLAVLLIVVAAMVWRLTRPDDTVIKSQMVGRPVPAFATEAAVRGKPGLSSADLGVGEATLVNVFASWCVPCIAEAPLLGELRRRGVRIVAIAVRDRPEDVAGFLRAHGDPFERIGADPTSQVQLAFGSSGVPETFVVDGAGVIRHQHVGAIEPSDLPELLKALEQVK